LAAAIPLLEAQRDEAKIDLYQPIADEVLGGLFGRVFRFLNTFLLDFHLWAVDLGHVVLRVMLESVFYMRFLSTQDQTNLYLKFQKYGIGQDKLYKMQLRQAPRRRQFEGYAGTWRRLLGSESPDYPKPVNATEPFPLSH
jgi:hypothetical protein